MFRSWVFLLWAFAAVVQAETSDQFKATVRFHSSRSQDSFVDETAYYQRAFAPWLGSEFGVRLSHTVPEILRGFDYKGEIQLRPIPFFYLGTRFAQRNYLPESTSASQLLFTANLDGDIFPFLGFFGSFGYFFRFPLLNKSTILPNFRASYTEKHFAFQFGFRIYPSDSLILSTRLATYDEMDVFNLQNPFFQGDLEYLLAGDSLSATMQFRYSLLLGFGRMDEWMLGVGVKIKLFRELELDDSSPERPEL